MEGLHHEESYVVNMWPMLPDKRHFFSEQEIGTCGT